jgi:tetratricopeptide (TPR) repeat protein
MIKQWWLTIIFFSAWYCGATQELSNQAHALYDQKQYGQAFIKYKDIEHKTAATWYNMGNCCYKLAQYPRALAYWRKADRMANSQQRVAIANNIDALYTCVKKQPEIPSMYDRLSKAVSVFPFSMLQLLCISLSLLLVIFIAQQLWRTRVWLFIGCVLFEIVLIFILMVKYRDLSDERGIINTSEVSVFALPDMQCHALGKLTELDELKIQQTKPGWCKIHYKELEGWVCADKIERV